MQTGEIFGGSIAVFIIVLIGLFVLPLTEELTGTPMLLVTIPIAIVGGFWFVQSLRKLVGEKEKETLRRRIQATRAGIIFSAALFWSGLLILPFSRATLAAYTSLPLDAKFLFWFGLNSLIAIRVYTSLLAHKPSEEEEPILDIGGLKIVEVRK